MPSAGSTVTITLIGFLAGIVGTGVGGAATLIARRPRRSTLGVLLGASAGVMLAVVCFELLPEAIESAGVLYASVGLVAGVGLLVVTDLLTPHYHVTGRDRRAARLARVGLMLGVGIAMHNLPEGLAIGSSYAVSRQVGFGIAFMIFLQNIPEGMAMAVPLTASGQPRTRTVEACCAAGVPMGLGALLGVVLGRVSPAFLAVALGFAAGAMIYLTADEIIPEAQELARSVTVSRSGRDSAQYDSDEEGGRSHAATFGVVGGLILGIFLAYLL